MTTKGLESIVIEIDGSSVPLDILLNAERRIVNDKLIQLYSQEIYEILKVAPLRIWVNPEDPNKIRVIDGLHRLYAVETANEIAKQEKRLEDIITDIPCIVETCSKDEFLHKRQQQTLAHGQIAGFRSIDWLIDAYGEHDFGVANVIPLDRILGLYRTAAKNPGKNFIPEYKIEKEDLAAMRGFVHDWITEYNLKGLAADDIYNVIVLIGRENIDILGLEDMKRVHIKTTYSRLNFFDTEPKKKRKYANHILRITAGLDRSIGKIQMLASAVNSGKSEYIDRIMKAEHFFSENKKEGAEEAYLEWKEYHEKRQVQEYRQENLAKSLPSATIVEPIEHLLEKLLPEDEFEGDWNKGDLEPDDDYILDELDEPELDPELEKLFKAPNPIRRKNYSTKPKKKKSRIGPVRKPVRPEVYVVESGRLLPELTFSTVGTGDIIYQHEDGKSAIILEAGSSFYLYENGGNRLFYRVVQPHLFLLDKETLSLEKPTIYAGAGNNSKVIFSRMCRENENLIGNLNDEYVPRALGGRYNELKHRSDIATQAAISSMEFLFSKKNPLARLGVMFKSETIRSGVHNSYVVAVPQPVMSLLAGNNNGVVKDFISEFGDSLRLSDNGKFYFVDNLPVYESVIQGFLE